MQAVEESARPKLIDTPLLTRREAAKVLRMSEREWDRLRKVWSFTEVYVLDGHKGLRFLSMEVEDYIWKHVKPSESKAAS